MDSIATMRDITSKSGFLKDLKAQRQRINNEN